ncbi:MAG TPA: class II glutamine amidotransferase, partial [Micromonosporaceae bacterium]|nr:class II glutamine amidotransferase [Micromonosporaceae bacterium]
SWAPRDMRGAGTINVDGFGVGWYQGDTPVRYRRDCPMWQDENFGRLAKVTSSPAVLAAARSATPGMPLVETASAPFTDEQWLFSLNGVVAGWPDSVLKLAERLPVRDLLTMDAPSDSAFVWALLRHQLRTGISPAEAVIETVAELASAAPGSRLNLMLTDGVTGVASAMGHALSVRRDDTGVLIASEPVDSEPGWRVVPDGGPVTATATTVEISRLPVGQGTG